MSETKRINVPQFSNIFDGGKDEFLLGYNAFQTAVNVNRAFSG